MRLLILVLLLTSCAIITHQEIEDGIVAEAPPSQAQIPENGRLCDTIPAFCQDVGGAVCGEDGKTYDNACEACKAGLVWHSPGPCPIPGATPCANFSGTCATQYDPVCGSDGETHSTACIACGTGIAWFTKGACVAGDDEFITCTGERPHGCADEDNPVCATVDTGVRCITAPCPSSKKQTFGNACEACSNTKVYGYEKGSC